MYKKVYDAAERLAGIANKTPVMTSSTLNRLTEREIFLKCENFQRMGAFKFRGAYNAISRLSDEARTRGVVTYSSGNHAQAAALAGRILETRVVVIMPDDAPRVKYNATKSYGAEIIEYDRHESSREVLAKELIDKYGYTLVPPYDSEDIIAGQGTAALELINEVGELDYVLAPCGGGGLLSGSAVIAKHMLPNCRVIGVEPESADDAARSFKSGKIECCDATDTIADGLRTPYLGKITFPLIQQYVDDILTVSEDQIVEAMFFLWTRMKLVVEPSGAVALAAVLSGKLLGDGKRAGIILSGGNADMALAAKLFENIKER